MVLFTRWLGQSYLPYKWTKFQCVYGWEIDRKIRAVVVAEGNFTSFDAGTQPEVGPPVPNRQTA